jgi:hypothetical protein
MRAASALRRVLALADGCIIFLGTPINDQVAM